MKICPRCGSDNVIWIVPNDESLWICKECDYTGSVIEGTEKLIKETRENYDKELKEEEEEINKTNQEDEPSDNLIRICPNCGSDNIDWVLPGYNHTWFCKSCGYSGFTIKGNEELIKEINKSYNEKLKGKELDNNDKNQENVDNTMKVCPNCGSDNLSGYFLNFGMRNCETCGYSGFVIEEDEELIREIREDYIKKLKDDDEIIKTNQENELSDNFMKICPKCGSNNIDGYIGDGKSLWYCKSCSYMGFAIEGNEELAKRIKESYEFNQENEFYEKKDLTDEELDKKLDELIEANFVSNKYKNLAEEIISKADKNIVEIYEKLSEEILNWNWKIKFKPISNYLTFSYYNEFLRISFDNDKINLQLSFNEDKPFDDYKYITKEITSDNEDDGITKVSFSIYRDYEIEYAIFLIKQSYKNNSNDSLLERFINKFY